jgi:hypothetical protein
MNHAAVTNPTCEYFFLGLRVSSEVPLPELDEAAVSPKAGAAQRDSGHLADNDRERLDGRVTIRHGRIERPPGWTCRSGRLPGVLGGSAGYLIAESTLALCVRGGRDVVVDLRADADPLRVRAMLLGPVMGAIHAQRGRLSLHGGAVLRLDGSAVVLAGSSGVGKSTLAMGLGLRGYPVLSDDVSVVCNESHGKGAAIYPGLRRVKLWPDSAETLGLRQWKSLPRVVAGREKRVAQVRREAPLDVPASLSSVCVLQDGPQLKLERLRPGEGLMHLVSVTYRMCAWPEDTLPQHMSLCASLLDDVPVFRLSRPRDLGQIDLLADFVEAKLLQGR